MFTLLPDEDSSKETIFDGEVPGLDDFIDVAVRAYVVDLLNRNEWRVANAAKMAKRNRTDFYKVMKKYGFMTEKQKELSAGYTPRGTDNWKLLRERYKQYSQSIGIKV